MSFQWAILKKVFLIFTSWEARRFEKNLSQPQEIQQSTLKRILKDFDISLESIEQFQMSFPLQGEEQITKLSQRLNRQQIVATETTSGSSGKPKPIPYTVNLMAGFHRMFRLWAWDVLSKNELTKGTFFFSISPQTKNTDLKEDSDYLQNVLQILLKKFWVIDAKKIRSTDPTNFMTNLSYELLKRPDLEIISIWSPSYLMTVFSEIHKNRAQWATNLDLPASTKKALQRPDFAWTEIWPALRFVSVWGSGMAEQGYKQLVKALPQAKFQAKGLLATEAAMTIPWYNSGGFVPLLQDVFFEFIDQTGKIRLLHELQTGAIYEIIITTFGGLFRYQIGDQVKVTSYYKNTPCLEFIGRKGDICDLAGEKLSEWAVRDVINSTNVELGFYIVVPDQIANRYILFSENQINDQESRIDLAFQNIFHYAVAREQGQISSLLCHHRPTLRADFSRWLESRNMRLGDIKEKALISDLSKAANFLKFFDIDRQQ